MSVLPLCVVFVAVLVAASTDVWSFRIHNALTIPLLILGLLYHSLLEGPLGFGGSVLGVIIATLPFMFVYMIGGMGAGDIKLMAGIGAWLGPWFALHVIIVSGLATGCYSAGIMACEQGRIESLPESGTPDRADMTTILSRSDRRWNAVPFGVMIAFGVVLTAIWIK